MNQWSKAAMLLIILSYSLGCEAETRLKVMSFNAWGAGTNAGLGIEQTVAVIRAINPDIIGLQEIRPETTLDHMDRIDFIFARRVGLQVHSAHIAGETGLWTDIAVEPYPSDHRAVVAEISF